MPSNDPEQLWKQRAKFARTATSTSFFAGVWVSFIDIIADGIESPAWLSLRILLSVVLVLGLVGWTVADIASRRAARDGAG